MAMKVTIRMFEPNMTPSKGTSVPRTHYATEGEPRNYNNPRNSFEIL